MDSKVMESSPTAPDAPQVPAKPQGEGSNDAEKMTSTNALLMVNVPQDARVFVNGSKTTSTGANRRYLSRGLQQGFNYEYSVRAEVTRDGKVVTDTKNVSVTAGQIVSLSFDLQAADAETTLTVHVPEDADVRLAGHGTTSTGKVRTFRTKRLANNKAWNDYKIAVSVKRDGKTITKEKTINLAAGENHSVTFAFEKSETAKIASAR